MKKLFFQSYKKKDYTGILSNTILNAISMHPVKDPHLMYKLHTDFLLHRLRRLQAHEQLMLVEMAVADELVRVSVAEPAQPEIERSDDVVHLSKIGHDQGSVMKKFRTSERNMFLINDRLRDAIRTRRARARRHSAFYDVTDDIFDRKVVIDERSLRQTPTAAWLNFLRGENPTWGFAILERKQAAMPSVFQGKEAMEKVTEQLEHWTVHPGMSTSPLMIRERRDKKVMNKYQGFSLSRGLQHLITVHYRPERLYRSFVLSAPLSKSLRWREVRGFSSPSGQMSRRTSVRPTTSFFGSEGHMKVLRAGSDMTSSWPELHLLVPLCGRPDTHSRFLKHIKKAAERYPAKVHTFVALFPEENSPTTSFKTRPKITTTESDEGNLKVTVVKVEHVTFSRALALNILAKRVLGSPEDVLALVDIDLIVTDQFLRRVALHVEPGTAYFPIFFNR